MSVSISQVLFRSKSYTHKFVTTTNPILHTNPATKKPEINQNKPSQNPKAPKMKIPMVAAFFLITALPAMAGNPSISSYGIAARNVEDARPRGPVRQRLLARRREVAQLARRQGGDDVSGTVGGGVEDGGSGDAEDGGGGNFGAGKGKGGKGKGGKGKGGKGKGGGGEGGGGFGGKGKGGKGNGGVEVGGGFGGKGKGGKGKGGGGAGGGSGPAGFGGDDSASGGGSADNDSSSPDTSTDASATSSAE